MYSVFNFLMKAQGIFAILSKYIILYLRIKKKIYIVSTLLWNFEHT